MASPASDAPRNRRNRCGVFNRLRSDREAAMARFKVCLLRFNPRVGVNRTSKLGHAHFLPRMLLTQSAADCTRFQLPPHHRQHRGMHPGNPRFRGPACGTRSSRSHIFGFVRWEALDCVSNWAAADRVLPDWRQRSILLAALVGIPGRPRRQER